VDRAESYLHAKFILIYRTVWPQYTNEQTGQTVQRSDSIGRTVLQTVAQKPEVRCRSCHWSARDLRK